jgi:hypothetical protein
VARAALCAALTLAAVAAFAANKAGDVVLSHGVVSGHQAGGAPRLLGPGSALMEGDVVTTGPRSVALLKLADGTKITLRPDSSFQIAKYDVTENHEEGLMTLFKGGLRAVTGFMSKRNPNAMHLRTAMATIGIRGTEFDARLCGSDCSEEAKVHSVPAGRAGFVKGDVMVRTPSSHAHALNSGAPVYNGDTVITAANTFAVLVFADKSRVTLMPNTEFRVERVEFKVAEPERSESIFNLLRGGLRAVSGLVGHKGRGTYQMRTAVATIGIRGTAWSGECVGACQSTEPNGAAGGDGFYSQVEEGAIDLDGNVVEAGQTVYVGNTGMIPQTVPQLPIPIDVPPPNTFEIPEPPPAPSSTEPESGLYVSCYSGICAVKNEHNEVELHQGESSHVGNQGGAVQQLSEVPPFQAEDPIYHAVEVGGQLDQLKETLNSGGRECTVH